MINPIRIISKTIILITRNPDRFIGLGKIFGEEISKFWTTGQLVDKISNPKSLKISISPYTQSVYTKMVQDIFDNTIICSKCNVEMKKITLAKDGFLLRAVVCPKCKAQIVHPHDDEEYNKYLNLRNKEFKVKMRQVGNSYAVSIPKEIVSFMESQNTAVDEFNKMVKLCFEDMGRLSLNFQNFENLGNEMNGLKENSANPRIVKASEVRVVKNGKPVLHSKQFYDSAHPEKNQNKIYRRDE